MVQFAFYLVLGLVVASSIYQLVSLYSAFSFFRRHRRQMAHPDFFPPVSILKPVRGMDDRALECWTSFCQQNYPGPIELVFGVRDESDPAVPFIRQLQQDFPSFQITLIINPTQIGVSGKVSNLNNMLAGVHSELLVLSDSDIRVGPKYLRTVVSPFANPRVGLVTCMYRAIGSTRLAALIEGIGITAEFLPGALVSERFEGIKFAMGSTIALRRTVLDQIGGFHAIADYLADDYLLGKLTADAGHEVQLSPYVVETVLPDYGFREFFDHQLRWARCVKYSRPGGYLGLLFTHTTVLALMLLLLSGSSVLGIGVGVGALTLRLVAAWMIGVQWLQDRRLGRYFFLVPVRDVLSFVVWAVSFWGTTVLWRGDRFRLEAGGKLNRIQN